MRIKMTILLLLMFGTFMFTIKVDAETTCSKLADLKTEAGLVEANYELVKSERSPEGDIDNTLYYYDTYITNVTEDLYIKIGDIVYTSNSVVDGTIKTRFEFGGYNAKIEIYGSSKSGCKDTWLRTITLKLPRYNRFSEYKECEGHTDQYPICARDGNTKKMEDSEFLEEIKKEAKEYQEKQAEKEKKGNKKDNKDKNVFELYVDNAGITIPITILIIAGISGAIYKVVSKDKKKAKIDLGVKKK